MRVSEGARKLERSLAKVVPEGHSVELVGYSDGETDWLERVFPNIPMTKPAGWVPDPNGESYLYRVRSAEDQIPIRVAGNAVENLPTEAVWQALKPIFPLSPKTPRDVVVVQVGDHAELL